MPRRRAISTGRTPSALSALTSAARAVGPVSVLLLHRSPGIQSRECGLLAMAVADLAVANADNAPAADFGALSASMDSTSTDRKGNAPSGPRGDSM